MRPARRRGPRGHHQRLTSRRRAVCDNMNVMALDPRLLSVLACPQDKGPLYYLGDDDGLYNPRLHRRYVVRDGIPVMLIDEAVAVDDAEHEAIMAKVRDQGLLPTFAQ